MNRAKIEPAKVMRVDDEPASTETRVLGKRKVNGNVEYLLEMRTGRGEYILR